MKSLNQDRPPDHHQDRKKGVLRRGLAFLKERGSKFSLRKFTLKKTPFDIRDPLGRLWGIVRGGQGVLLLAALVVLAPTFFTKTPAGSIGGSKLLPTVRYRTIAEIASADTSLGLTSNPDYNTEETVTSLDGDFLFKTGTLDTIISRSNRRETIEYEVKSGESLYSVANDFGIATATLSYVNHLSSNTLKPGQKLKIPPVDGLFVKVQRGENLSTLASRYRIDLDKIYQYNPGIKEGEPIFAGQEIFIPGAVVPKSTTGTSYTATTYGPPALPASESQFIWPVASVTKFISQGFGRTRYNSNHTGIDLPRRNGLTIYVAASGIVHTTTMRGYGYTIIINHGNGWETYYAHLSRFLVNDGDYVSQGQAIAIMGSTGWSTGTHLHFEIRKNGVPLNPLAYLPR